MPRAPAAAGGRAREAANPARADAGGRRRLGRTGSWLGWFRAARLLLHPDELEALLELDIVKGPLAEARGPASLSFLAGGHLLARNLDLRQRLVALLGMTRAALGAGILALLLAASVLATGSNVWFGVQDASEAAAVLGSPR